MTIIMCRKSCDTDQIPDTLYCGTQTPEPFIETLLWQTRRWSAISRSSGRTTLALAGYVRCFPFQQDSAGSYTSEGEKGGN